MKKQEAHGAAGTWCVCGCCDPMQRGGLSLLPHRTHWHKAQELHLFLPGQSRAYCCYTSLAFWGGGPPRGFLWPGLAKPLGKPSGASEVGLFTGCPSEPC